MDFQAPFQSYDSFWSYEELLKPLKNPKLYCPLPDLKIEPPGALKEEPLPIEEILAKLDEPSEFSPKPLYKGKHWSQTRDLDDVCFQPALVLYGEKEDDMLTLLDDTEQSLINTGLKTAAYVSNDIRSIEVFKSVKGKKFIKYRYIFDFDAEGNAGNSLDLWIFSKIDEALEKNGDQKLVDLSKEILDALWSDLMSVLLSKFLPYEIGKVLESDPHILCKDFFNNNWPGIVFDYNFDISIVHDLRRGSFYPFHGSICPRVMYPIWNHSFEKENSYDPFSYHKYKCGATIQEVWSEWTIGLYGKESIQNVESLKCAMISKDSIVRLSCKVREPIIKFITYGICLGAKRRRNGQYFTDILQATLHLNQMPIEELSLKIRSTKFTEITFGVIYTEMDSLMTLRHLFKCREGRCGFKKLPYIYL